MLPRADENFNVYCTNIARIFKICNSVKFSTMRLAIQMYGVPVEICLFVSPSNVCIVTNEINYYQNSYMSHMGFQLVPTSVTLNDLEQHNIILHYFTKSDSFACRLHHSG